MAPFIWTVEEVTAPASGPVTLVEAKDQVNVETAETYWDSLLNFLIVAAVEKVEGDTGRALLTRAFKQYLNRWPNSGRFALMRSPVSAVAHVKWTGETGTVTTLVANTDYLADTKSKPPAIVLPSNKSWPSGALYPVTPIEVQFSAGYVDAAAVPAKFKFAMRLLISHWFKHREAIVIGSTSTLAVEVPLAYKSLLDLDRSTFIGNGAQ